MNVSSTQSLFQLCRITDSETGVTDGCTCREGLSCVEGDTSTFGRGWAGRQRVTLSYCESIIKEPRHMVSVRQYISQRKITLPKFMKPRSTA